MYRVVQIEYFSLKVSLNSIPTLYFALFVVFNAHFPDRLFAHLQYLPIFNKFF